MNVGLFSERAMEMHADRFAEVEHGVDERRRDGCESESVGNRERRSVRQLLSDAV